MKWRYNMKHCNKCNLDVNTFKKTCPLCGELLDSDSEQCDVVLYPKYKVKAKKKNMALRVVLFLLIVASITTIIVNYYTFESFNLKTRMPEYSISVYKISKVYNTLTYKVDLQSGYSISNVNVEMTFNYDVIDSETGEVKQEVATLKSSASVPEGGAKYVTGTFDISAYELTSDTLLKLTVKNVEVTPEYILPINSSYTFRFGR
jgi:uncharacterized membrane protein YvbJ